MRKGVNARIVGIGVLSAMAVAVIGLTAADAESPVDIKTPFPSTSHQPKPPLNEDGANHPDPPPPPGEGDDGHEYGEGNKGFDDEDHGNQWGEE
jgi:hypothetical protein